MSRATKISYGTLTDGLHGRAKAAKPDSVQAHTEKPWDEDQSAGVEVCGSRESLDS